MRRQNTASITAEDAPKRTSRSQNTGKLAVTSFITKNEKPQARAHATMSSLLNHSVPRRPRVQTRDVAALPPFSPTRYTRSKSK